MDSINRFIVTVVKFLPKSVVFQFAKKYIAGKTLDDAVRVVRQLNSKGIVATLDVLGESIKNTSEAEQTKNECIRVLETIDREKLDANLSIKLTALGLAIDKEYCHKSVEEIVAKAKELNNFVRIDMEDSPYTDLTIDLYRALRKNFDNVGIVLQAYLKRTLDDIENLKDLVPNYRLCKGIYIEPPSIAYKDKQKIRDNYMSALEKMFEYGSYVGIATHDKYLIDNSYKLIAKKNIPESQFEFQMLYGVTEYLRDKIKNDGHKIRIYVPYGEHWYPYSIRRMQENPEIAWYVTKSIFSFRK